MRLITTDEIQAAAERIDGFVTKTPLLESERLSSEYGCSVTLKAENLQRTASFKVRGALNTLLRWREDGELPHGVVSFSAGNHAAAIAYAGQLVGVRVIVSMPTQPIPSKAANVRRFGGEIVPTDDLMGTCAELAERTGYPALYPFNLPEIIAGQGTLGREIAAEGQWSDLVLVPVGGGGLVGGVATAVKALSPRTRVVGVEPAASNALGQALRAKEVVRLARPAETIADGLAAPAAGEFTLGQAQAYVDDVVEVSEGEITRAWYDMIDVTKLVVEPSAAVGLAALQNGSVTLPAGGAVTLVVSGGNTDLSALPVPERS